MRLPRGEGPRRDRRCPPGDHHPGVRGALGPAEPPPPAGPPPFSSRHVIEHRHGERKFGYEPLEAPIHLLEHLELLGFAYVVPS
jgi:hypothetical protein